MLCTLHTQAVVSGLRLALTVSRQIRVRQALRH